MSEQFLPRGLGLSNRPPRKEDCNREGSIIFPESSLWVQIYDLMLGCKTQRNHGAHRLGTPYDELASSQIRQQHVDLLPLLELLSDKIKAALEDTDAWQKAPRATLQVADRPDYAKEFPEAEAILLAREEELDGARTEFVIYEQAAKEAWANKSPGTEIYDSEIAYIRFTWLASGGIEFEDCSEGYEYLEDDEVAQFGSSTESDEGAEPETLAQDQTLVETPVEIGTGKRRIILFLTLRGPTCVVVRWACISA